MGSHFYHTSEFAQKASVSVRTLRYYDNVGLLSPTSYTEAGYRLYTETDLSRLQQILALKFLGFSLEEIRQCLQIGPTVLQESLALQKAMMQEKRVQLDAIIKAIDETEGLLQANQQDWDAIVRVIQVIQMTQSNDWRKKYFTDEQLQQAEELLISIIPMNNGRNWQSGARTSLKRINVLPLNGGARLSQSCNAW